MRSVAIPRLLLCGFSVTLAVAACGLSGPGPLEEHVQRSHHTAPVCKRVAAAATRAVQAVHGVTGDHDASQLVAVHARDRAGVARFRVVRSLRPEVTDVYHSLNRLQAAWLGDSDAAVNRAVTSVARRTSALRQGCTHHPSQTVQLPAGAHKMKHVIVIMQENRSFDHDFVRFRAQTAYP